MVKDVTGDRSRPAGDDELATVKTGYIEIVSPQG